MWTWWLDMGYPVSNKKGPEHIYLLLLLVKLVSNAVCNKVP